MKSDKDEVSALNSRRTQAEMAYVVAVDARAKASVLTSKFDELKSVRSRVSELEGHRDEFQRMTATRDMLNRSTPVAEAEALFRTLNANLMDTEEKLERVEDDIKSSEAEYEAAMIDSERTIAMVADVEKMKVANVRIRDMLPKYERAKELRRSVAGIGAELETLSASTEEMADRLERSSARMSDIDERLGESADIDSRIHIEEMGVEGVEAELSKLNADRARGSTYLKSEDVVGRSENSFVLHDAQARAIAADLSGDVPCPVYGSLHYPSLASLETDVPNKDMINRLGRRRRTPPGPRTARNWHPVAEDTGPTSPDSGRARAPTAPQSRP